MQKISFSLINLLYSASEISSKRKSLTVISKFLIFLILVASCGYVTLGILIKYLVKSSGTGQGL